MSYTGLEFDPRSTTALADRATLIGAQQKLAEMKEAMANKQYNMVLRQVDAVLKEIGGNFREFNLLKVEALLELSRPEDAYNLSNTMVRPCDGHPVVGIARVHKSTVLNTTNYISFH